MQNFTKSIVHNTNHNSTYNVETGEVVVDSNVNVSFDQQSVRKKKSSTTHVFILKRLSAWILEKFKASNAFRYQSNQTTKICNPNELVTKPERQEVESAKLKMIYEQMVRSIESRELFLDPRLTQEDVIRYLGTNRRYLYEALKMYCNTNFKGFINMYRVRYAQSLIKNKIANEKDYLLCDIYVDCGFSTNESFYRTFKNLTGTSPGKYAEEISLK